MALRVSLIHTRPRELPISPVIVMYILWASSQSSIYSANWSRKSERQRLLWPSSIWLRILLINFVFHAFSTTRIRFSLETSSITPFITEPTEASNKSRDVSLHSSSTSFIYTQANLSLLWFYASAVEGASAGQVDSQRFLNYIHYCMYYCVEILNDDGNNDRIENDKKGMKQYIPIAFKLQIIRYS